MGGGSEIVQICVSSFMEDNPIFNKQKIESNYECQQQNEKQKYFIPIEKKFSNQKSFFLKTENPWLATRFILCRKSYYNTVDGKRLPINLQTERL